MPNRLLKIQSELRSSKRRSRAAHPTPITRPTDGVEPITDLPKIYQLTEEIKPIASDLANGSWASAYSMMASWRKRQPKSIEAALTELGARWLAAYQSATGLADQQAVEFIAAAGLVKKSVPLTVESVYDGMTEFGPLWLALESPSGTWSAKAWLITGITGDGTPEGATLHAIDANAGTPIHEGLSAFVATRLAGDAAAVSLVHWPAAVRIERAQPEAGTVIPMNLKTQAATESPSEAAPDLTAVIADLVSQGADEHALLAFLDNLGAPMPGATAEASAIGDSAPAAQSTVTLPGTTMLDGFEAIAFRAALRSAIALLPGGSGAALGLLVASLPMLANRLNVTIGIGPAVSGGIVAGAGFGAGIVIAPNNRIGVYGSVSGILGAIVSMSATVQATVVKGGPENFAGESVLAGVSIDTAVGPTIAAHAILSPNGGFLGVTGEIGVSMGLSPFEAFAQYQYTATSLGVAYQSSAGPREFDVKLRIFIPAPAVDGPGSNPFGGDGRTFDYSAGSDRGVIHAKIGVEPTAGHTPRLTIIDRDWGPSTEYNQSDVRPVPGMPSWYKELIGSPAPIARAALPATPSNLSISVRNVALSGGTHAVKIKMHAEGAMPLRRLAPAIDANLEIYIAHVGAWQYMIRGDHDGFPAYELYLDRHLVYSHDPIGLGQTPASLLPPSEFSVSTPWRTI